MLLKNGLILIDGVLASRDVLIDDNGVIVCIGENLVGEDALDVSGLWLMPSAVDVHVHLREPGYEYKETVLTGTTASAKGGVGTIMPMPNLNPCPDCVSNLKVQTDVIERDAVVKCYPFASVTVGENGKELSDLENLARYVKAFTDDGKGVNNLELLKKAMIIGIMKTMTSEKEEVKEFDYIGVLYPEGFITAETLFMFNHDDITDVIVRGYENPERAEFIEKLDKNMKRVEELQKK